MEKNESFEIQKLVIHAEKKNTLELGHIVEKGKKKRCENDAINGKKIKTRIKMDSSPKR